MKILGVGNSFTENACRFLSNIDKEAKAGLCATLASIGGCSLEKHVSLAKLFESDPAAREGRPYPFCENGMKTNKSLKELLLCEKWDVVTIQQYSAYSPDLATYRPHAAELCAYIRLHAPGAEIVVHQTWAYRVDDPAFNAAYNQAQMHEKLDQCYRTIAAELGALRVIPVGDAFRNAMNHPRWRYVPDRKFNLEEAIYPSLPNQANSLWQGWKWDKHPDGTPKLYLDAHHANAAGELLGGLVWYEFFTGKNAEEICFRPESVAEKHAAFLRGIAHQTVVEEPTS